MARAPVKRRPVIALHLGDNRTGSGGWAHLANAYKVLSTQKKLLPLKNQRLTKHSKL